LIQQEFEVGDAIAAALEHFELIVEAFDEAARLTAREIVRDLFKIRPPGHTVQK
jgi:hypothetical protein